MLMIWSHDPRTDYSTIRHLISDIDRIGANNASGSYFKCNLSSLIEVEGKNVFVVTDGNDGLQDKDARAGDDGVSCTVVGVFPKDTIVNLVAADDIA